MEMGLLWNLRLLGAPCPTYKSQAFSQKYNMPLQVHQHYKQNSVLSLVTTPALI